LPASATKVGEPPIIDNAHSKTQIPLNLRLRPLRWLDAVYISVTLLLSPLFVLHVFMSNFHAILLRRAAIDSEDVFGWDIRLK
jgi:hypothetical protein